MHETLDSITRSPASDSCSRSSWASLVGITEEECGRLLNTVSTILGISARVSVLARVSVSWSVGRTLASAAGLESNLSLLVAH